MKELFLFAIEYFFFLSTLKLISLYNAMWICDVFDEGELADHEENLIKRKKFKFDA